MFHVALVTRFKDGDFCTEPLCDVVMSHFGEPLFDAGLLCKNFENFDEADSYAKRCSELLNEEFMVMEGGCPNNN